MKKNIPTGLMTLLLAFALGACSQAAAQPTATKVPATSTSPPPTATPMASETPSPTITLTPTATASPSASPTVSETPPPEDTPTPTATETPETALATALGSVNCRYGPDKAYLYAWGLSEGDTAEVKGKNATEEWLWVTPYDTVWNCWITASAVELNVPIEGIDVVYPQLLTNPQVGPPTGVHAVRSGDKVTISWNAAPPAIDLGYLIEARICLGAYQWDVVFSTQNTSYTINDPQSCSASSYGQVRVYNKLGYSSAVKIGWP
ncbi:MAG: hypothetical protein PVF85_10055 [Anaerolineales bacterium]|jgi:hypothetical protein